MSLGRTGGPLLIAGLLLGSLGFVALLAPSPSSPTGLLTFASRGGLFAYLDESRASGDSGWLWGDLTLAETTDSGFSGTNVQVADVDEADLVKTDGEYLYLASGREVVLLRASPPEVLEVVSRIPVTGPPDQPAASWHAVGLFLLEDRLIVLTTGFEAWMGVEDQAEPGLWWPSGEALTLVAIWDVTDPTSPELLVEHGVSGTYRAARMTGETVYLIAQSWITQIEEGYTLPTVCKDSICAEVPLNRILYDPEASDATSYTNLLAVDPLGGDAEPLTLIAGYGSTVYMSPQSLYITYPKVLAVTPLIAPQGASLVDAEERTSIYKIVADRLQLQVAAQGEVPGRPLNQFSLDERDGLLRVVTTTGFMEANHVFILDGTLQTIGALRDLAPGERVYAARFVGEALYLVTFKKVDPFFVIDLADPEAPQVLGFLKIPGFSDYLHPIDPSHILGVGKETVEAEEGDWAWYQGLKLSLFDVSEVGNPQEMGTYLIGDRGTTSPVLYDHKAFLRVASRSLVVLPLELYVVEDESAPFEYGQFVWQGAYVLAVTPERIDLVGTISHVEPEAEDPALWDSGRWIYRSLYIGDFLYTISPEMVQVHALGDLAPVNAVVYASP